LIVFPRQQRNEINNNNNELKVAEVVVDIAAAVEVAEAMAVD